MRPFWTAAAIAACGAVVAFWILEDPPDKASASVDDGLEITIELTPFAWTLHREWQRTLHLKKTETTVVSPLVADTGWWEGSVLYRHVSGNYVVNEGENGCFTILVDPPSLETSSKAIDCRALRRYAPEFGKTATPTEPPQSRFFADLRYLGTFRSPRDNREEGRIRFLSYRVFREPQLRPPM